MGQGLHTRAGYPDPCHCLTATKGKGGKGKGKAKAGPDPAKNTTHTGCQPGSQKYNNNDVDCILHLAEEILPIRQNTWGQLTRGFNAWAEETGQPPRTQKLLKTKFESVYWFHTCIYVILR